MVEWVQIPPIALLPQAQVRARSAAPWVSTGSDPERKEGRAWTRGDPKTPRGGKEETRMQAAPPTSFSPPAGPGSAATKVRWQRPGGPGWRRPLTLCFCCCCSACVFVGFLSQEALPVALRWWTVLGSVRRRSWASTAGCGFHTDSCGLESRLELLHLPPGGGRLYLDALSEENQARLKWVVPSARSVGAACPAHGAWGAAVGLHTCETFRPGHQD